MQTTQPRHVHLQPLPPVMQISDGTIWSHETLQTTYVVGCDIHHLLQTEGSHLKYRKRCSGCLPTSAVINLGLDFSASGMRRLEDEEHGCIKGLEPQPRCSYKALESWRSLQNNRGPVIPPPRAICSRPFSSSAVLPKASTKCLLRNGCAVGCTCRRAH